MEAVPREAKNTAAQTCGRQFPRETLTSDKTQAGVRRDVTTPVPNRELITPLLGLVAAPARAPTSPCICLEGYYIRKQHVI